MGQSIYDPASKKRRPGENPGYDRTAKDWTPVQFEPLETARTSVLAWLEHCGSMLDDYAFPSRSMQRRSPEQATVREAGRRVGHWNRTMARRLSHVFVAAHEDFDHLQGDAQSESGPASAQPLED
jgi:hypothetical protein